MTGQLTSLHTEKFPKPLVYTNTHLKGGIRSSIDYQFLIQWKGVISAFLYYMKIRKGKKKCPVRSEVELSCFDGSVYTSRLSDGSRRPRGYIHFPCNCRFLLPSGFADYDYTPYTTTSDVSCKNIPIPTNNTVTQEAFTVKYECFNLMECAEPICCLTYTTCSTVHIHSFHKKYIFVYTAFTLSYSRAAGGASSRMYGRPQNTSDPSRHYVSHAIMQSPAVCLILPAQLPGSGHVTSLHRPTPSLSSTSQQK